MSISKRKIATISSAIISAVLLCISSYLVGAYGLIKSDHTAEILDAISVDIRPKEIDAIKIEEGINVERIKAGLPSLAHNDALTKSACMKLDHMVANNYWAHVSPSGVQPWYWFSQAGYRYVNAGENLAYGTYTVSSMVSAWMNSPKHKDNILGNYTQQGVCSKVVKYMNIYTILAVNHFGTPY